MAVEPLLPTVSAPAEFTAWIEEVSRVLDHQIPGMRIATTIATADSAGFTTTDVEIDSVTAPLVTGLIYRVRWYVAFSSSTTDATIRARIHNGTVGGADLALGDVDIRALSSGIYPLVLETEFTAGSTGNQTFVASAQRISGTGTQRAETATTRPRYLYVDYIREA